MPEAPDGDSIMGCDAANGTYFQLYSDERGVCRVYEMSIGDGDWKLWREGEPFAQRFSATISDDGNTITGRWELARTGHVGDRLRPHLPQGQVGAASLRSSRRPTQERARRCRPEAHRPNPAARRGRNHGPSGRPARAAQRPKGERHSLAT